MLEELRLHKQREPKIEYGLDSLGSVLSFRAVPPTTPGSRGVASVRKALHLKSIYIQSTKKLYTALHTHV